MATSESSIPFEQGPNFGSEPWNKAMQALGNQLNQHKVRQVFFVHGTFVGTDPLGIFAAFKKLDQLNIFGELKEIEELEDLSKKIIDKITDDVGNYTDEYVKKFGEVIGNNICNEQDRITWDSGNNHYARLEGVIKLAKETADRIKSKPIPKDERILFIGHSHAGQVFALLTTFLEGGDRAKKLFDFIEEKKYIAELDSFKNNLDKIKGIELDFVTFGTPVRYTWGNYNKFRLKSVINHRHNSELIVKNILEIKDGDYVQQWGVEGTDLETASGEAELSEILKDAGVRRDAFSNSLEDKSRRQPHKEDGSVAGSNILVDYKDNISIKFNISKLSDILDPFHLNDYIEKIFGHGCYTTEKAMYFNTALIVKNLYDD